MDIRNSIVGIFSKNNSGHKYSGTGFFVTGGLILTCAHVVDGAYQLNGKLRFNIDGKEKFYEADVIFKGEVVESDIAILKPSDLAESIPVLPLVVSHHSEGHEFKSFGYPLESGGQGLYADGKIHNWVRDALGRDALQISSNKITHGFSGCPLWDDEAGGVIGMVSSGFNFGLDKKLGDVAFAIPSEIINTVYPMLVFEKHSSPGEIRQEKLYSNLLEVQSYGKSIYIAQTHARGRNEIYRKLLKLKSNPGNEFILRNKTIISFNNLSEYPWSDVCDPKSSIQYSSDDWALSQNINKRNEFIDLLRKSLETKLLPEVFYDNGEKYYFFAPTNSLAPKELSYPSLTNNTSRTVFKGYSKKTEQKIGYYRHSAFWGKFLRFENKWYLEITPTYRFTTNGYQVSKFSDKQLSTIKRLELNPAVLGQIVMWAEYLSKRPDMFTKEYPFLSFGKLVSFDIERGIDDESWLRREDADNQMLEVVNSAINDLPLFRGLEI